jgi:hypothetical protein
MTASSSGSISTRHGRAGLTADQLEALEADRAALL